MPEQNTRGELHLLERLRRELETERSSFISHWRELNDFISPRRARFVITDHNKGDKRHNDIIDSTATFSLRTLKSGMMGGITSPARPWFKLSTGDTEFDQRDDVKDWLDEVARRMSQVFLRSNLYKVLPIAYGDMGLFGTGCLFMEEDFENVVRFTPVPIGSYTISNDVNMRANMFFREFRMTARQLVNRFGRDRLDPKKINWDVLSSHVQNLWETDKDEQYIDVVHAVVPNKQWDPDSPRADKKRYIAVYYERGQSSGGSPDRSSAGFGSTFNHKGKEVFLERKGFDFFPVMAPRWEVTGEDVYGTDCPGMTTLGDVKQLQLGEKRSLQGIEKSINPPMTGPTSLKNKKASIIAGDITYMDIREGQSGFRPIHEIAFRVDLLEQKQQQVRQRIQRGFFEDLFLMLTETDRRQITATEVIERKEEKLLALGPVLEQLNQDLLDPLIDNTFALMVRQRLIPPAPEELRGRQLNIEYISIMAEAQKLASLGSVERLTSYVGQLAAFNPEVLHKFDADQAVDIYADITSAPNGLIRSDEEVATIRSEIAAQQQAAEQQEQLNNAAGVAKDLSETSVEGGSALDQLLQQSQAGSLIGG